LPRGQFRNRLRDKIAQINKLVADFVKSTPNCDMLDISCDLVREGDDTISHRDMYDYLHLTTEGYKKTFEMVYDYLLEVFNANDEATEK
jgi:platelet-activating factor acetylhydrolase IB subunit beta/gamma